MKKIWKAIKSGALYLWQLPQNLLGLVLRLIYKGDDTQAKVLNLGIGDDQLIRTSEKMKGGISLGKYIIVKDTASQTTIKHELGHSKQSLYLGPLYLLVIGLPSALHASVHNSKDCWGKDNWIYYSFYTEKWADKLAKIERNFDSTK